MENGLKMFLVISLMFSFSISLLSQKVFAFCEIKQSCNSTEACVLSLAYKQNSHVAECDYYPYKLCCDGIKSSVLTTTSCPTNSTLVLRTAYKQNSHVAEPGYQDYPYKLCVDHMECEIRNNSCEDYEACVLSLAYKQNSHVAECDYYPYKLCCVKSTISINLTEPENNKKYFRGDMLNLTTFVKDSLGDPFSGLFPQLNIIMSNGTTIVLNTSNAFDGVFVANYSIDNADPIGEWKIVPYGYKKYYRTVILNNSTILVFSNITVNLVKPTEQELYYGFTPGEQINFEVNVTDESNKPVGNAHTKIYVYDKDGNLKSDINTTYNSSKLVYESSYNQNLNLGKYTIMIKSWGDYMENATINKTLWIDKITIDYTINKYRYYPGDTIKINGVTKSYLRGFPIPYTNITVDVLDENGDVVTTYKTKSDENGYFTTNFKLSKFLEPGVYYVRISAKWSE